MRCHIFLMTVAVAALGLVFGCSSSDATSCESTEDCFSGEYCDDGICAANSAPANHGSNTNQSNDDTGNNSNADATPNSGTNDSTNQDGGQSNDTNSNNGQPDPECILTGPEVQNCDSGHEDLEDNTALQLHADGVDAAGCATFGDHDSFQASELTTWEIQACPNRFHRFHLLLNDCRDKAFTALLRIEPKSPQCGLDEYAELTFSEHEYEVDVECGSEEISGRHYACYYETLLDNGGFEWIIVTREATSTGAGPKYVEVEVDIDTDAYFEYEITTEVEPLD